MPRGHGWMWEVAPGACAANVAMTLWRFVFLRCCTTTALMIRYGICTADDSVAKNASRAAGAIAANSVGGCSTPEKMKC